MTSLIENLDATLAGTKVEIFAALIATADAIDSCEDDAIADQLRDQYGYLEAELADRGCKVVLS